MSEDSKSRERRLGLIDRLAEALFLARLREIDPLTADRLVVMLKKGMTMDDLITWGSKWAKEHAVRHAAWAKEQIAEEVTIRHDGSSDHLRNFAVGVPAYRFLPSFTRTDLIAAFFEEKHEEPKRLPLCFILPNSSEVDVKMAVKRLEPFYFIDPCDEHPKAADLYIEAELVHSSALGPPTTRVRIVLYDDGQEMTFSEGYLQVIHERPESDGSSAP